MEAKDLAPSTTLALVHGILGQLVFATAMVSAFVVSGAWQRADAAIHRARSVRMLTMLAFLALCGQLFLGASIRHLQVPPTADAGARIPAWALHGHVTMAMVAFFLVLLAGLRCSRVQEIPPLRRLGKSLMHTVGLQLVLGIAALVAVVIRRGEVVPWWEVASTTAHQVVGALLLAITASAMVLARRTREA
jgi:heme A synthase